MKVPVLLSTVAVAHLGRYRQWLGGSLEPKQDLGAVEEPREEPVIGRWFSGAFSPHSVPALGDGVFWNLAGDFAAQLTISRGLTSIRHEFCSKLFTETCFRAAREGYHLLPEMLHSATHGCRASTCRSNVTVELPLAPRFDAILQPHRMLILSHASDLLALGPRPRSAPVALAVPWQPGARIWTRQLVWRIELDFAFPDGSAPPARGAVDIPLMTPHRLPQLLYGLVPSHRD